MKLLIIANNIEGDADGIGKHARIVAGEINRRDGMHADIISGTTAGFSTLQRTVSLEMHNAFTKAVEYVTKEHPDAVVVEYPFNEFNPIIVSDFDKLKAVCKNNACILALSMHEYDRVKKLRKMVVEHFVSKADIVYVSEPHYLETLKGINPNLYLRTIPNHIPSTGNADKDRTQFAFFGMVNKAKAFDEMIAGWKEFNSENRYRLNIVTRTEIQVNDQDRYGIKMHFRLKDEAVADVLAKSSYGVCPIIPSISFNNSSFVSLCQCGCVPMGVMSEELADEKFALTMSNYSKEEFIRVYREAVSMTEEVYVRKSSMAGSFGSRFTLESTVDAMLTPLKIRK